MARALKYDSIHHAHNMQNRLMQINVRDYYSSTWSDHTDTS